MPTGTIAAVGDTAIRKRGRREVKWIKVSNVGPHQHRWMRYSRFVWEAVNGPVPAGKRLIHKDGDTLNDSLENLMLGTASDVLWVHCHSDPEKSAANYKACRKATAKANRRRARTRRREEFLPSRFYAVHPPSELVWNDPKKRPFHVAKLILEKCEPRTFWSAVFGFPNCSRNEAVILRVLGTPATTFDQLAIRVGELRKLMGWRNVTTHALSSDLSRLRRAAMITGSRGNYRRAAEPLSQFLIIRGDRLAVSRFGLYRTHITNRETFIDKTN